jgi:formyl-CoA transferase
MLDTLTMDDGSTLAVPGICPKLSRTPGRHRRNAPGLGQDNAAVLAELAAAAAAAAQEVEQPARVQGHRPPHLG